jgi:PAS domain S-box-containing protein
MKSKQTKSFAPEPADFSPSLLNSLLDSITDIVFFKDMNGVYLGCNPAFTAFVGRPKEAIVGKTDYELFDRAAADFFRTCDQQALERRQALRNEEWITYPDGRRRLIETLKTPYWGPDGSLIGVVGISRDITETKTAEEALRDSEANFRTFFETIDDLILVTTHEGRILFANKALKKKLGYTAAELEALTVLDLHAAPQRKEAAAIFAAMLRDERESCPLPLLAKSGACLAVETRVWLGKWNGEPCLFGVSKDLSAEQEAQQRFERLFRNNPNLMAVTSLPQKQIIDVNDAFLRTLGYASHEILGKTSAELGLFVHPEHHADAMARLDESGRLADTELFIRRKDGVVLEGLFSGERINNQGRQYLLTVMNDITARKQAEREIARLSMIQRELMQLATHFVNVPLDRQEEAINQSLATMGRIISADRAYLFAYDFARGLMSNTHEWCGPGVTPEIGNLKDVPLELFPEWVQTHRRGETVHIPNVAALSEADPLRQTLEPQGIQSLVTLPLMQGTDCLGFVGFDAVLERRNWSEDDVALLRVLAELYSHFEMRLFAERETRTLQASLTEARDTAQESARAKTLFLANMSHEIRTPLNAILGYAQIMGHECRACPSKQRLNAISRSGEHLLKLITDLLDLARSDGRLLNINPAEFDFHRMLEDVHLMFARQAELLGLTFDFHYATDLPRLIVADQGKIRQVLVNLAGNAFKFTEEGGILISATRAGGETPGDLSITVDVHDTGCGMREDELTGIFNVFEQTESGRKSAQGTGLGLPLSQRYAQALGGDIAVSSRPGEGSQFRFTFKARAGRTSNPDAPLRTITRLAPDQRPPRVLLVDDDPSNRDMLAAMLAAAGFPVETVGGGLQALDRLRGGEPVDIVLMDQRMPGMDGLETIRHIRKLPAGPALKVLVITASGAPDEEERARTAGADGYLPKPINRAPLLDTLGRLAALRYEYAPEGEARQDPAGTPFDLQSLARLPADQRQGLEQGLRRGDINQLRSTVDAIEPRQPDLAARLRPLVEGYEYDRLHRLLESTRTSP